MKISHIQSRRNKGFDYPRVMGEVDVLDHDGFTWRLSTDSQSPRAKEAIAKRFFADFCSEYRDCEYRLVNVDEDIWRIQYIPLRDPLPRDLSNLRF